MDKVYILGIFVDGDSSNLSGKKESNIGKYIIPNSCFSQKDEIPAYILGIPCKILSDPYAIKVKDIFTEKMKEVMVIDVKSMVSNIKYTIYEGYGNIYDTLEEANTFARIKGTPNPSMKNLIGMKYYVNDNSFIMDFNGKWHDVYKKECTILSIPFKDKTYAIEPHLDKRVYPYILVRNEEDNTIMRVLFQEWSLIKDF